jgi:hypothetical protein
MTKRLVLVLSAVLVLSVGGAVAYGAAKPTKHAVNETIAVRVLTSTANGATFTGTDTDKAFGTGVLVVKAVGAASATVSKITGTAFFKSGSVTVSGSVTTTPRADGSGSDFSGTAKAVSGTGVMKGVTGTVKLVGSSTSQDPTFQTYKATGTFKY